jgi:hypothetical protein
MFAEFFWILDYKLVPMNSVLALMNSDNFLNLELKRSTDV